MYLETIVERRQQMPYDSADQAMMWYAELPFMRDHRQFVLEPGSDLIDDDPAVYQAHLDNLVQHCLASDDEIAAALRGEWQPQQAAEKVRTYNQLVEVVTEFKATYPDGVVGLALLTADPPHYGHAHLLRVVQQACSQLSSHHLIVAGIDSGQLLRERKGRQYFGRAAAIINIADLPWVSHAFVVPYARGEVPDLDAFFAGICGQLQVDVLGSSADNTLLPVYMRRMRLLGGCMIAAPRFDGYSSTYMMTVRRAMSEALGLPASGVMGEFHLWAEHEQAEARKELKARGVLDRYLRQ